ncbi:hypothetical protein [Bathymodiolus thermophilus thioautotrophic gill symbiont]|uniref:Uncharacterized protein n=1 Tax=Bathymodiolus thermophilus thioautotrophic gill symbiont TaxID=2360 RepID=A0A1J5UN66_9GAMM|nr:hypothetical protein [Bathymodiolus thermophilus thioautotrophic gill symbiont]OIR25671.1 hypothetical protein BGC33_07450 [Bathymodiolus thermophilus thioautotrophic gill symbiont]
MSEKNKIPSEQITLKNVGELTGLGIAYRSSTVDNEFILGLTMDVVDPEPGKSYEGWLVKKEGEKIIDFYSTGMAYKASNKVWVVSYAIPLNEKSYYRNVVITEVTGNEGKTNGVPGKYLYEGVFVK